MCAASWMFAPKGEYQVYVLILLFKLSCFVANLYVNQHVAIVAHPRHCQLLPDVGSHFPSTAAPPHCPETKRSPRAVPRVNTSSAINIDEVVAVAAVGRLAVLSRRLAAPFQKRRLLRLHLTLCGRPARVYDYDIIIHPAFLFHHLGRMHFCANEARMTSVYT